LCQKECQPSSEEVRKKAWKKRVDLDSGYYFFLLFAAALLNTLYQYEVVDYWKPDDIIDGPNQDVIVNKTTTIASNETHYEMPFEVSLFKHGLLGFYWQLFACYTQMMIIVGLCSDGGKSYFSRFCRTSVIQVFFPKVYLFKSYSDKFLKNVLLKFECGHFYGYI
jgi:hypothetical protein